VTPPLFFIFMIMLSYILMILLVFPCKLIINTNSTLVF
jgi:hypothetical protein